MDPKLEKLAAKDYRFIVICLLLLAGTAWYTTRNFYRAFPEASIDFRVNRDGARAIAFAFANRARGAARIGGGRVRARSDGQDRRARW